MFVLLQINQALCGNSTAAVLKQGCNDRERMGDGAHSPSGLHTLWGGKERDRQEVREGDGDDSGLKGSVSLCPTPATS